MNISDCKRQREAMEEAYLAPGAARAAKSRGRSRPETPCPLRTNYQQDRDRILHCGAFRCLKHKTQVFLGPRGDNYRTRLTHTLEVAQIARTIASGLRLNEDLTEAIALGHDLGHTPFGHAGERALDEVCPFPFKHHLQSVRVVEKLEREGRGLNLTFEVKNGIACHSAGSCGTWPLTLEGQAVRWADKIAYLNHDIEDAIRAGVISEQDIPWEAARDLGRSKSQRISTVVFSLVENSDNASSALQMDSVTLKAHNRLLRFMFDEVYASPQVMGEEQKARGLIQELYRYYLADPQRLPLFYQNLLQTVSPERAVCDYIASMSDYYAVDLYKELVLPKFWPKL